MGEKTPKPEKANTNDDKDLATVRAFYELKQNKERFKAAKATYRAEVA